MHKGFALFDYSSILIWALAQMKQILYTYEIKGKLGNLLYMSPKSAFKVLVFMFHKKKKLKFFV